MPQPPALRLVTDNRRLGELRAVPSGSLVMGSEAHHPEERPARRVDVDRYGIEAHPVTNAEFRRFVMATGHVTVAERAPDSADFPDATPEELLPGSLVFTPPPGPVPLDDWQRWWSYVPGANWRHPGSASRRARRMGGRARLCPVGGPRPADRGRVGVRRTRRA